MNSIYQFLARKSVNPGFVRSAARSHLGDDHQTVRIGMERLLDDLIRHVRAIEIAGIDVIHSRFNGLSQDPDGFVGIARRSPHLRTGQLHGAITNTVHGQRSIGEA